MAMESSEILDLRDELLEKEKELSGMQNLLLEQDEDIRACQQRLGELESALLLACPPSSATSNNDDEDHCPHTPASPRDYPVQRTLYESASTEIAGRSDIDEEEQSEGTCEHLLRSSCCQERSPKWSGGGAGTASTPEMAGEERSAEDKRSPQLDIYGRRLDRSFRMQEEVQEPIEVKECDNIIADVSSGDDQHKRVDGGSIPAGRVGCAEPRAEAAEAAAREAATAAVTAVCETRVAKDETERLRAEVVELSRWREAVLNLRDKLDIDQRDEQGGGGDGSGERRTNEDDPLARHAKWVSSPALKALLPRLHQNSSDLLADLAAAHGPRTPATPLIADVTGADNQGQAECTPSVEAMERPLGKASSRNADYEGEEPAASVDEATPSLMRNDDAERQLALLRKECKTSQIVIHALREKDEESQKRVFALEGEVFQASLTAVKQEALVSALRRQLEMSGSCDARGQRPQLLTPRHTGIAEERSTAAVSAEGRGTAPLLATPATQSSVHDRRYNGVDSSRTPALVEEDAQRHPCGKPCTPTTDILRRLLYENTPKSSSSCAEESDGKTGIADAERCGRSDHVARRSRNGRRLFADGSTVLRSCPASSHDVAGSRRGPAALFSDPACGTCGVEVSETWTEDCSSVLVEREEGETESEKATLLGEVKAVVGNTVGDEVVDQNEGQLGTGEVVLRERLLQARKEFLALLTGAPLDLR